MPNFGTMRTSLRFDARPHGRVRDFDVSILLDAPVSLQYAAAAEQGQLVRPDLPLRRAPEPEGHGHRQPTA